MGPCKSKNAVNVTTQEESFKVQKALYNIGYKWRFENAKPPYNYKPPINEYKSNTVLLCEPEITYTDLSWAKHEKMKIVSVNKFFGTILPTLQPYLPRKR